MARTFLIILGVLSGCGAFGVMWWAAWYMSTLHQTDWQRFPAFMTSSLAFIVLLRGCIISIAMAVHPDAP